LSLDKNLTSSTIALFKMYKTSVHHRNPQMCAASGDGAVSEFCLYPRLKPVFIISAVLQGQLAL